MGCPTGDRSHGRAATRRRTRSVGRLSAIFLALVFTLSFGACAQAIEPLRVVGNRLVSGHKPVQLRGVNFSGAQYECLTADRRVWDVPADRTALEGMRAWAVNAVRLPLNEDCWLEINGLPRGFAAARYRREVIAWVDRLHQAGIYVLLNLHIAAPGKRRSTKEEVMADADHAPAFWRSIAHSFRHDRAVIFDLYNEPKRIGWKCWRDGCRRPYRIAGMQGLVNAVRRARATQPVMADGLNFSNDLSGWLRWRPRDPRGQLIAGFHDYDDGLGCESQPCWGLTVARVAAQFPVVMGEIGEMDCSHKSVDRVMNWADDISYLAWAWNATGCTTEPSLLSSPDSTPSPFGQGVHDHLISRRG